MTDENLEEYVDQIRYLKQYEENTKKVTRLYEEYLKERDLIDSIRSSLGGDGTPHGTAIGNPTEQKALRLADKLIEYTDTLNDAMQITWAVFDTVMNVPGVMGDVLYWRYIKFKKTWDEIADIINYGPRQTMRIHKKALAYIKDVIKCP